MPKVRFLKEKIEIEVPEGSSILEAARKAGAPEGDAAAACARAPPATSTSSKASTTPREAEDEEQDILDKAFDVRRDRASAARPRSAATST